MRAKGVLSIKQSKSDTLDHGIIRGDSDWSDD